MKWKMGKSGALLASAMGLNARLTKKIGPVRVRTTKGNPMLEFYKTNGGRRFIDSTMPRIADALEKLNNLFSGLCESAIEYHTPSEYRVSGDILTKMGEVFEEIVRMRQQHAPGCLAARERRKNIKRWEPFTDCSCGQD